MKPHASRIDMTRHVALFTLATGLAVLGVARGAIVYFPGEDIPLPNTHAGVSVDLESGNWSSSLDGLTGGDANFFLGGSRVSNDADAYAFGAGWQPVRTGTGNTDAIVQLPVNTTIDLGIASYSTGYGASGQINSHFGGASGFTVGAPGYLGFSLIIDNPANPGNPLTVYGWALVTLENNDGAGVLHEWAFEDTGAAIQVAAVPEPNLPTLVSSLAFLWLLRRRR
jgi:hypothetical protein